MKNVYYGRTIQASKVWHENNSSSNSIVHECFEVLLACFSRNFPFGSTSEKAPLAQVCKWLLPALARVYRLSKPNSEEDHQAKAVSLAGVFPAS